MVSVQVMVLVAAGTLLTGVIVALGVVWLNRLVRKASLGAPAHTMPDLASSAPLNANSQPSNIDTTVLSVLSERLAVIEGRLPALQAALDGYGGMSTRIATLEGLLPNLADAYDKFSQNLGNAEKRRSERERRQDKKEDAEQELSVDEAVARMGDAAKPQAANNDQSSSPAPPAGVFGQGGPGRRR